MKRNVYGPVLSGLFAAIAVLITRYVLPDVRNTLVIEGLIVVAAAVAGSFIGSQLDKRG